MKRVVQADACLSSPFVNYQGLALVPTHLQLVRRNNVLEKHLIEVDGGVWMHDGTRPIVRREACIRPV